MATDPIGGGPLEPNQPGGPANVGGPPNLNSMQDALNTMAQSNLELNKSMAALVDQLTQASRVAGQVAAATEDISDNVKDAVNESDRMTTNLKAALNAQKDFNNNIKGQKRTYGEILQHTQAVLNLNKQLLTSGKANAQQTKVLEGNMKVLEKVYEDAGNKAKQFTANTVASDAAMKDYSQTLMGVTRSHTALAQAQGKVASSRLEQHVIALNRSYRDAGMQVKIFEKLEETYARNRALREVREAKKAHTLGKRQDIQDLMARSGGAAAGHLGVDLARTKAGGIDWAAMKARGPVTGAAAQAAREMDYGAMAKEAAYRGGRGFLGRADAFLTERAFRARAAAQMGGAEGAPGMMGKAGIQLAEAGGGSVLGGAAETGLSAMAELAGPAAALYAIGRTIQKGWDTMAHTNAAIEKALGASLFTPGMTGGEALLQVRQNLSASAFNAFGQNLDRNLAIADAMRQSGLDISEMTRGNIRGKRLTGGAMPDTGAGFLGGTFGEFQRNVMTAGRAAGLTDGQTVVRMTKMVTEMRQTFEATHDFLEGVNVAARAAGISTTAYLSLVDNLNDKFTSLNKSFAATVSILQTLGATGTATSQDLKDMSEFITGTNETKTTEQNTFAFSQMSKATADRWVKSAESSTGDAADRLRAELEKTNKFTPGELSSLDLTSAGGILQAQNMIGGATGLEATQKIALKKLADEAYSQSLNLNLAKQVQGGNIVGAGVGLQAIGGGNALTKTEIEQQLLTTAMQTQGMTLGQLRKNPELIYQIPGVVEALKPLGKTPQDLEMAIRTAGQFQTGMIAGGAAQMPEGQAKNAEYQKILRAGHAAGVFKDLGPNATNEQIQKALGDQGVFSKVAQVLEEQMSPEDFTDALHGELIKGNEHAQDLQDKDIAMQTRDSADVFANVFEKFFTMLMTGIMEIVHTLKSFSNFMGGTPAGASAETMQQVSALVKSGALDAAMTSLSENIRAGEGGPAAQAQYDELSKFQMMQQNDPDDITDDQADRAAAIMRANAIAGMGTTGADWDKIKGMRDMTITDEQAIRELAAAGGGGQFGDYDQSGEANRFWLGKNLDDTQMGLLSKELSDAGIAGGIQTEGGKQYITITMNSTDIQAFMNRFGIDNLRAPNNSGETTKGPGVTPVAKPTPQRVMQGATQGWVTPG